MIDLYPREARCIVVCSYELHKLARQGDTGRVEQLLESRASDVNAYDPVGCTPLMYAVMSPKAGAELVRLLIQHGTDVRAETRRSHYSNVSVMALALGGGNPGKVRLLLEHGSDIRYQRKEGYDALIDAVHSRDILHDEKLIELLRLLIAQGVELSGVTSYSESGLRVLSRIGRFDAVKVLLDAGADPCHLQWTPLMQAIALGSLADVERELETASIEERDYWERTPWLLAIQTGDITRARLLLERGTDISVRGRCGKPPLFYAIQTHHASMLRWLLEIGTDIGHRDDSGKTPLMCAVEGNNLDAVNVLLAAGAGVNDDKGRGDSTETALSNVRNREIALRLLEAGADIRHLPFEGRRALLGFPADPDEDLLEASAAEYHAWRSPRFGTGNPERIHSPFWEGMIRSGITGFQAAQQFQDEGEDVNPVWCAQRFGQSITFLPDGRIIQIAGEHEDYYDPDFYIYNDLFVHHPDGTIEVFGYPETVFPPTDNHTATLLGRYIYLIGSLGYAGSRRFGKTPVYRLDTESLQIEQLSIAGDGPGWIYKHTAAAISNDEIRVSGGTLVSWDGNDEVHSDNTASFVLSTTELTWRLRPAAIE